MKKFNINEYELLFEVKKMQKYLAFKKLEQMNKDDIIRDFKKNINKRINLIDYKIKNSKNETEKKILIRNKNYLTSLKPYLNKEDILNDFKKDVKKYDKLINDKIKKLELELSKKKKKSKKKLDELNRLYEIKEYIKTLYLNNPFTVDRFSFLLSNMIENIITKSNFSSYTDIWQDEMKALAYERVLRYLHNFDDNIISPKTGQKPKAFSYLTQIINNSFIYVIKNKNQEDKEIKKHIGYDVNKNSMMKDIKEFNNTKVFKIKSKHIKQLNDFLEYKEIIKHNDFLRDEYNRTGDEWILKEAKNIDNIDKNVLKFYENMNKQEILKTNRIEIICNKKTYDRINEHLKDDKYSKLNINVKIN